MADSGKGKKPAARIMANDDSVEDNLNQDTDAKNINMGLVEAYRIL